MSKFEKIYYSVGDLSAMFNVNPSLIRFWEKEFKELKPKKNRKGNRMFSQKDLRNFHMIYHLVKEKGYTLKGAKEALRTDADQLEVKVQALQTLHKTRQFLVDLDEGFADKLKELTDKS